MIMGDVDTLVDEFDLTPELGNLVVERRGVPVKNEFGEYEPAVPVLLELTPWTAHNVSGRDLLQVPEADRNSEIVQFYTRDGSWPALSGFRVSDDGSGADVVLYQGRRFRVVTVRDFSPQGRVWCAMGALEEVQAIA